MPRPCKRRRICAKPACRRFGPVCRSEDALPGISMALEEYEAIRLIDLLGMTQEECAGQMGVSRTTVQSIYALARKKLAECVVNGRELLLEGGDYVLCTGMHEGAGAPACAHACRRKAGSVPRCGNTATIKPENNQNPTIQGSKVKEE